MNILPSKLLSVLAGLTFLVTPALFSLQSQASQCNIHFNYGVVIDPLHIRILNTDKTYVQINGENQLFVSGREIKLAEEQQILLTQYSQGIRKQIPEIISIAIDGVDVGLKAVNKVIAGLTGENSASHQKLQKRFDELQWRIRKRFNQTDNNFYIASQDFDDFDEIFAGEFESEIEAIVSESIGTILTAVGDAMANNDQENSEQRVDTFDDRLSSMGKELKLEIGSKANAIESKTELFCQQLKLLNNIETQLIQTIPQLTDFDLIQTSEK